MTKIDGKRFLTISVEAGEVYELNYKDHLTLNILNNTSDNILISVQGDFPHNADSTVGYYLTLPSGTAANAVRLGVPKVYIKAAVAGDIVIERCG